MGKIQVEFREQETILIFFFFCESVSLHWEEWKEDFGITWMIREHSTRTTEHSFDWYFITYLAKLIVYWNTV